jgi:hypothetical protein
VRFRALPSRLRACCTTQVLTLTLNASRSSLPRSTMWASCWLSASDRTRGQGLRDMATSHAHQSSNTSRIIVGNLLRTGCQWRFLPGKWPKWQTVHSYFAKWSKPEQNGVSVLEQALKKSGWRGPRETGAQRL